MKNEVNNICSYFYVFQCTTAFHFYYYYYYCCCYIIIIIAIIINFVSGSSNNSSSSSTSSSIIIIIIFISRSSMNNISVLFPISTSILSFLYIFCCFPSIYHCFSRNHNRNKVTQLFRVFYPCHRTLWRCFLPQILILMNLY